MFDDETSSYKVLEVLLNPRGAVEHFAPAVL